jgi:nucleoside-diphosphate-sugar epimerase
MSRIVKAESTYVFLMNESNSLLGMHPYLAQDFLLYISQTGFLCSNAHSTASSTTETMPLLRIAIAGATGNLGLPILSTLTSAGYPVIALSRIDGNHSRLIPHPNLTIKEVDFTSVSAIAIALQDVKVVVSCLATSAMGSQNPLIDASVAAGVERFIPAEFGMDSQNPLAMQLPVCVPKVKTQQYLREQAKNHSNFTWTGIANGMFLDWGLEMGIIVDPVKHTATLYNGGDIPFSATTLTDVAKAVLGVINNQNETENRLVYVHSALVTQNQLIRYIQNKDGKEWDIVVMDTEAVKRNSFKELEKGSVADVDAAMLGLCFTAMFDLEYGCDFTSKLSNEVLGLKELHEAEVMKVVESYIR